ncbi:hypothetical protein CRI94_17285 [Longibacter salinarum]|uniref:Uncharacterized protein n=1 Tax=Longibacter salinarum TaxID=1850348 RepID=A0A2A8CT34_9BACT|nr:hypothetical protein [Longibacter salinarum]PEN10371.1 hypothetical protein CRI94_17285 [Longibacter salinarum]
MSTATTILPQESPLVVRNVLKRAARKINNLRGKVNATDTFLCFESYQYTQAELLEEASEVEEFLASAFDKILAQTPNMSENQLDNAQEQYDEVVQMLRAVREVIYSRGRTAMEYLSRFVEQAEVLATTLLGLTTTVKLLRS